MLKVVLNFSAIPRDRWFGQILRWLLRLMPEGLAVPILQGPAAGMWWTIGATAHGCWLGSYEAERQPLLAAALYPGATFFDLGANAGFYTLLASRLVGPTGLVIAIEPDARNLRYLRRHLTMNRLENVRVVEGAVTDRVGVVHFVGDAHPTLGWVTEGEGTAVQSVTLDHLVFARGFPPPTVIKMDIEGSEAAALRGALKTLGIAHPMIFLSTHSGEQHQECTALLTKFGYRLVPEPPGTALKTGAHTSELIASRDGPAAAAAEGGEGKN